MKSFWTRDIERSSTMIQSRYHGNRFSSRTVSMWKMLASRWTTRPIRSMDRWSELRAGSYSDRVSFSVLQSWLYFSER